MMTVIYILLGLVVLTLLTGVIIMGIGGKLNAQYSNKLMQARVIIQALIVAVVGIMVFVLK